MQLTEPVGIQIIKLFLYAIPVACISWTVVHEEVFHEVHEFCVRHSKNAKRTVIRKFFYLFTCEYCFSHYISIAILWITGFQLIFDDWRGYLIAGFSLVWIANIYMGLYNIIRLDIKTETLESKIEEKKLNGISR